MFKRENHETVAETKEERELLHGNVRYKKRGKDLPDNNVFQKNRNNLENTRRN